MARIPSNVISKGGQQGRIADQKEKVSAAPKSLLDLNFPWGLVSLMTRDVIHISQKDGCGFNPSFYIHPF